MRQVLVEQIVQEQRKQATNNKKSGIAMYASAELKKAASSRLKMAQVVFTGFELSEIEGFST